MNPKVSIITPTHNRAHFLGEMIQNIREQSESSWELLIIDNASTDNTQTIVQSWSEKDSRIRYLSVPKKGISKARNFGIAQSKGTYIALIDDDDLWEPHKLSVQLAAMEKNPSAGVCITDGVAFSEKEIIKPALIPKGKSALKLWMESQRLPEKNIYVGNFFDVLLQVNCVIMSSVLMTKSLLDQFGGFDAACDGWEGYNLWLRLSRQTKFLLLDKKLIRYRTLSPSMMGGELEERAFRTRECDANALEGCLDQLPVSRRNKMRRRIAKKLRIAGWYYHRTGKPDKANQLWRRSLRHHPFQARVCWYLMRSFLLSIDLKRS